ncbi:hypothetical protein [Streptomyces sp. NPDC003327]
MTVTRPARLIGAALCGALGLVCAVWILRDLAALGSPTGLFHHWIGDHALLIRLRAATSLVDPVLLLVTTATAVAALRSRHAASALAATGAVTLALRLPGLWAPGTGALVTGLLDVALAAGLLVTAAAGRRPAASAHDRPPTRPRTAAAVAAAVLLALAALVVLSWEVHRAGQLPAEITVDRFLGGRYLGGPDLGVPPGWLAVVLVVLCCTAAGSAVARARHTRAFGLLAGAFLGAEGLADTAGFLRSGVLPHLAELTGANQLSVLSALYGLLAGAAVLALLAGPGAPAPPTAPYPPAALLPPPPPHPRPPGW